MKTPGYWFIFAAWLIALGTDVYLVRELASQKKTYEAQIDLVQRINREVKPCPFASPSNTAWTLAPPAPVGAVLSEKMLATNLLTLPKPDVFGFIRTIALPVQTESTELAAALTASPVHVARWRGNFDTFWAQHFPTGTQCWGDGKNQTNRGLVWCKLVPTTFHWQPVAWQ